MNTSEELKARAAEIRDAEQAGENTAHRVGSLLCDLVDLLVGDGSLTEAVITATQRLVSQGAIEAEGAISADSIEVVQSRLGSASASVLNLLRLGRASIYIMQASGGYLEFVDLNTNTRVMLPTSANGVVALAGNTATKAEAAALSQRIDALEGSGTVPVVRGSGTFYRHGVPCTDNWCEKFAASAQHPPVVVKTADAARKFNLRDQASEGIYIASGVGQRWDIVVPEGYVIRSYKIVATLRVSEGVALLTPAGGQDYQVIPNYMQTIEVNNINATNTYFTTEDISTVPSDLPMWLKTFEVVVERIAAYATTAETAALDARVAALEGR